MTFGFFTNMDLRGKFILPIVTGLIVVFSISAIVTVAQQKTAFQELLKFSQHVVEDIAQKNSQQTLADESVKIEAQIEFLKQISVGPVAELEISVLSDYAKVVLQNSNFSYVGFTDMDGQLLTEAGELAKVDPKYVVTKKLIQEEVLLGSLTIGYNFDAAERYTAEVAEQQELNLQQMNATSDSLLDKAKISLLAITVLTSVGIALLVGFMFKIIVCARLFDLEVRMQEIATGDGDLRQRLEIKSKDTIGRIGTHLNNLLEKLQGTIQQVVGAAQQLTISTGQMTTIVTEERKNIIEQKLKLEQSAAAVGEMAATVQDVAGNAVIASDAAQKSDQESKVGMGVVSQTITSINELAGEVDRAASVIATLEEDSNAIGAVLDVIRGIAEQTNLLALNAAIEAARAGEQGRGFAVVADEVRTLASRTQKSTAEIQAMIEKLQSGSNNAVKVMEAGRQRAQTSVNHAAEAGESLKTITKSVEVISEMNLQIANASKEQRVAAEEINRNIVAISDTAKQSEQGVNELSAASGDLHQLTQQLEKIVHTFKV